MKLHPLVVATATLVTIAGCVGVPNDGARLAINVAPLDIEPVTNARYQLTVKNAADEVVWTHVVDAAGYGTAGGSLSYVGTCDAQSNPNKVTLEVLDLYNATSTVDPGTYESPGPITLPVECVENQDTAVDFDITILIDPPATTQFVSIGVSFADIFCSAKLDCRDEDGDPLLLLHDANGDRAQTAVVAMSCTAGAGASTVLYRDDLTIVCDDGAGTVLTTTVDPSAGPGNLAAGSGISGDTGVLYGAAVSQGDEHLGYNKAYWNIQLGLEPGAKGCTLTTTGTAHDGRFASDTVPAGVVWPYIDWNVPLTDTSGALVCTRHPVNGAAPNDGVVATYTDGSVVAWSHFFLSAAAQLTAYGYTAFSSSGSFTVPAGVSSLHVVAVGGGGGGGGGHSGAGNGGGGGGGGRVEAGTFAVTPGTVYPITVGAGGVGGSGGSVDGASGAASSVGGLLTAAAGGGGWSGYIGGDHGAGGSGGGSGGGGGGDGASSIVGGDGGTGGAAGTAGTGIAGSGGGWAPLTGIVNAVTWSSGAGGIGNQGAATVYNGGGGGGGLMLDGVGATAADGTSAGTSGGFGGTGGAGYGAGGGGAAGSTGAGGAGAPGVVYVEWSVNVAVTGALTEADPGHWSDGTYAPSCDGYFAPGAGYTGSTTDGVYTVDPDGAGGIASYLVYCDMTNEGGGWTLVLRTTDVNAFAADAAIWYSGTPAVAGTSTLTPGSEGVSLAYQSVVGGEVLFRTHAEAPGYWTRFTMPITESVLGLVGTTNISAASDGYKDTLTYVATGVNAHGCWAQDWRVRWRNYPSGDAYPDSSVFAPSTLTASYRPCGGSTHWATGVGARTDSSNGWSGYGGSWEGVGSETNGNADLVGGALSIWVR